MGEEVSFPSNGQTCRGYLAAPAGGGPGVVVIQEWWGLVDHIRDVCDRLAAEGFVALAPDLYHGRQASEPDEARKLQMALDLDRAAKDMAGAVEYLRTLARPPKVGCVGFCMGGALSLVLAASAPVEAAVTYYGIPFRGSPDFSQVRGAVLGHFASEDDWASPKAARELFDRLSELGVETEFYVYPGTRHAFFNDTRPEVYDRDAARTSWERTLAFFRKHLA